MENIHKPQALIRDGAQELQIWSCTCRCYDSYYTLGHTLNQQSKKSKHQCVVLIISINGNERSKMEI